MAKGKKKTKSIFDGIRKETAPPSQRFRTRKYDTERKAKHRERNTWERE